MAERSRWGIRLGPAGRARWLRSSTLWRNAARGLASIHCASAAARQVPSPLNCAEAHGENRNLTATGASVTTLLIMSEPAIMSPRTNLLNLLFGLSSIFLTLANPVPVGAENKIPDQYKTGGFFIGCQAYTFNHFTVFEAIEKTTEAGGKVIEFYPGQKLSKEEPGVAWDHNASPETIQKVKDKLAEHKIKAVNYGVVGVPKDEVQARKLLWSQ